MKKYQVMVTEVLKRLIEVEADNETKALELVKKMYSNCTIVLDASDYEQTEISVEDEKSEKVFVHTDINR